MDKQYKYCESKSNDFDILCKKCYYCNESIVISNKDYLLSKYLHDIRNMKILDKNMINNIYNMSDSGKMDIITNLNNVIESLKMMVDILD